MVGFMIKLVFAGIPAVIVSYFYRYYFFCIYCSCCDDFLVWFKRAVPADKLGFLIVDDIDPNPESMSC